MQTDGSNSRLERFAQFLGYLLWMLVIAVCAPLFGYLVYDQAWRAQLTPDPPGQFSFYVAPIGKEWSVLAWSLLLYAGLAWRRLGGLFTAGHVTLLALISAIYLDHIEHLYEIYMLGGPRPLYETLPPILAGSSIAGSIIGGLAFWHSGGWASRFGLRSILVATLATAVVLTGFSEATRREREQVRADRLRSGVEWGGRLMGYPLEEEPETEPLIPDP